MMHIWQKKGTLVNRIQCELLHVLQIPRDATFSHASQVPRLGIVERFIRVPLWADARISNHALFLTTYSTIVRSLCVFHTAAILS